VSERRGIGRVGAAAIGIGGMVGGGIFAVLGTAVALAKGGTPVAFVIAGVVALLTAYSYTKLSVNEPNAGGTVVFVDRAFGVDAATGAANLMLWIGYLVTIALYAAAFGSYAVAMLPGDHPPFERHVLLSVAIVLPAIINLLDADIVSRAESFIVAGKLGLLFVVIVAGWRSIDFTRLSFDAWSPPGTLVAGGMVIFVAYEGFELIANAADDIRDPSSDLPWAYYGSVVFVIALYVLVAIVTVGSVSEATILRAKDYALAEAAKPSLGAAGFTIVSISALMATFSAINATIYGNARLGYSLAKDGELPELLDRKTWSRPVSGVLVTTVLSLLVANLVDLEAIAIMGSAGFLVVFAVVNAAGFRLAGEIGAKRLVCALGAVACVAALVTLLVHTWHDDPRALAVFGSLVAAAIVFEAIYPRVSGRRMRIAGKTP